MKRLLPYLAICLTLAAARAQEPAPATLAAAEKLAAIMDFKSLTANSFEAMSPTIAALAQQMRLDAEAGKELKQIFLTWFNEDLNQTKMVTDLVQLYASTYTEEELNGLISFYGSPLGQKYLQKTPELMKKGMEIGRQEAMAKQEQLKARLEPFFKSHAPKQGKP